MASKVTTKSSGSSSPKKKKTSGPIAGIKAPTAAQLEAQRKKTYGVKRPSATTGVRG